MMALNRYRLKALSAKNNAQAKRVEKLLKKLIT
jgi:Mg2+/Co2+ transporter CorB